MEREEPVRGGVVRQSPRWLGWRWSGLSNLEKFDAYTRWSMYFMCLLLPFICAPWRDQQVAAVTPFWISLGAFTLACLVATHAAFERSPTPSRYRTGVTAAVLVTGAIALVLARLAWPEPTTEFRGRALASAMIIGYAICVLTIRASVQIAGYAAAAGLGLVALTQLPLDTDLLIAVISPIVLLFIGMLFATRSSFLMLELMRQVDDAREVEARLAVAEERLRFARDLHDTLGRNLSAIALKAQVANAQIGQQQHAGAQTELDAVRELASESLGEMRAVVRGYRSSSLPTEITGAKSLLSSAGIACHVIGDPDPDDDELAWVVREAVTNVIRHSRASQCRIEIGPGTLRVWNDGAEPADPVSSGGTGLAGLQGRLARRNGRVVVRRPRPDEFELTATIGRP